MIKVIILCDDYFPDNLTYDIEGEITGSGEDNKCDQCLCFDGCNNCKYVKEI